MLPMCVLLQLMVPPPHHEFSARMVEYLQAVQGRMSEGGWVLGQGGPPGCGCGDQGARPGPGGSGNVARWGGQTFAFGGVKKLVSEVDFFYKKRPKFEGRPLTHFFGTLRRNFHYGRPQFWGQFCVQNFDPESGKFFKKRPRFLVHFGWPGNPPKG